MQRWQDGHPLHVRATLAAGSSSISSTNNIQFGNTPQLCDFNQIENEHWAFSYLKSETAALADGMLMQLLLVRPKPLSHNKSDLAHLDRSRNLASLNVYARLLILRQSLCFKTSPCAMSIPSLCINSMRLSNANIARDHN